MDTAGPAPTYTPISVDEHGSGSIQHLHQLHEASAEETGRRGLEVDVNEWLTFPDKDDESINERSISYVQRFHQLHEASAEEAGRGELEVDIDE